MGRLASVVLITWNSAPHLRRCLDGIASQTHRPVELIAVDNASRDDSAALVAPHAAKLIRNETNRGFSAAANQALAAASGEFVVLLNPDCFLDPHYIERIVGALCAAGEQYGMATGKLLRAESPELIDSKGIRMTRSGRHFDIGQGEPDSRQPTTDNTEVFGVSGAAAVYRMSFLRDVAVDGEIFDEDFFAYREDADLAWRGRIFGWRAMFVPAAIAHHVRRVTPANRRELPPSINMHSVKNRFLLRLKNESFYLAVRNAMFEIPRDLVTIGAVLTVERSSMPALTWLWRNRRRILEKRRAVQRRRRVPDRELARWFR